MSNVFDVAEYILRRRGRMSALKLQKLVYYSQAWSLAWDDAPLFDDPIEAWANGPVVRALYEAHRGEYFVTSFSTGNPDHLTDEQKETIDSVIAYYGGKSAQWLSDLTHMEDPWRLARRGLPDNVRSNAVISLDSMAEYYTSISPEYS